MEEHKPPNSVQILRDTIYLFPESACAFHTFASDPNVILLIEQWRPLHNRYTLELPGGRIETGETPETAALRELKEEAGIEGESAAYFIKLDLDFSASKHSTHIVHTRSAHHFEIGAQCRLMSLHEAREAVMSGVITHAPTVATILFFGTKEETT